MPKPTLSVIITNYNHSHFLPESLPAILSQSYPAKELIIIDDASTDDSVNVIERFAREHSNIRLIRNSRNMGVLHNVKVLFDLASGDYVFSASSDDSVLPGFFEQSIEILARFPRAGLCFSDPATFVKSGGPIRKNRLNLAPQPSYLSSEELVRLSRRRSFQIAGHTSILNRALFLKGGGLIPELKWHCDWFSLWVLAFRYGACYIPAPLASLRMTPGSYSTAGRKHRGMQGEIMTSMLRLLRTQYKDVESLFQQSAILSCFNTQILRAVLRNPEYWNHLSSLLIRRALGDRVHRMAAELAPQPVKEMYRRFQENASV